MISNKIKILPSNISNKIAAGEVVQRPESVLKELMENSVDARAKNIEVFIKNAGKTLIQVVDDGDGMSEEDAELSVQRHATSKISTIDDLSRINTFGFRGEALSSISAVSLVEIKTEKRDDEIGTLIKNSEGNNFFKEKGSFAKGTSVAVKNLFYNTPARRNFLKSNATELKHIIDSFKNIALSNPGVTFKFYNDDDMIFDFPAASISERMKSIFAENILDAVIEIEELTEFINITGYIAKPTFLSKNRGSQYLFVNKRYVQSRMINHAIFSAYENILEKGDYPFFVLFMEIDPAKIDINVHPSKLEIKFEQEKDIYTLVNAVAKKGLGSYDLVPAMNFGESVEGKEKLKYNNFNPVNKEDFSDRPGFIESNLGRKSDSSIFSDDEIDALFSTITPNIKRNPEKNINHSHPFEEQQTSEVYHEEIKPQTNQPNEAIGNSFIFSLHNKYILAPIKSGLMIIDQHVAHERILYEKALKSFDANLPFAQQLLFAQTMEVDPGDYQLLKEIEPFLNKLGFEVKFFSRNTIVISGVPSDVKIGSEVDILREILSEYKTNQREKKLESRENLAASFSCKAAIKAGDKLDENEMRLLVDQLFATSMPYVCPHGRPIVIKIPLDEFDKRFGRT